MLQGYEEMTVTKESKLGIYVTVILDGKEKTKWTDRFSNLELCEKNIINAYKLKGYNLVKLSEVTFEKEINPEWKKYNNLINEGGEGYNPHEKYTYTRILKSKKI
jgi:hypothetical protein